MEVLERLKKSFEFLTDKLWRNSSRKWKNDKFSSACFSDFLERLRLIWNIRERHNLLISLLSLEEQGDFSSLKTLEIFESKRYLETDPVNQKELDVLFS